MSLRSFLPTILLLSLVLWVATPAAAHLYLVNSQPADGADLTTVPRELRLRFSEPAELAFTRVDLLGADGAPIRLADAVLAPDERHVLVYAIEGQFHAGRYSVSWRTTSADGHPVRGSFTFTIAEDAEGLAPDVPDEAAPAPAAATVHHDPETFPGGNGFSAESPGYVVVRWLTFIGLLGVIGIVTFRLVVLGLVRRSGAAEGRVLLQPASRRSAGIGLAFSLLLAVAVVARLLAQSLAMHGSGAALDAATLSATLTRTTWGTGWLLQAAAVALVAIGFALAWTASRPTASRRQPGGPPASGARTGAMALPAAAHVQDGSSVPPSRVVDLEDHRAPAGKTADQNDPGLNPGWLLAGVGALVLAFTPALGGHAIGSPEYRGLAVLSDGLHVLGAAGWLGGLLAILLIGIPAAMRLGPERRGAAISALVNAFSPTALAFAALVTITGVLSASFHLGSLGDLWQSDYGRTLLLKLGILSLLFATGAYNWLRVRPALGDDAGTSRLRRSAGFEIAVGAAVLLVTAVLVATPPPQDHPGNGQPVMEAAP